MSSLSDFTVRKIQRVVQLGFAGILLLVMIYTMTSLYHIRESTQHLTEIVEINNKLVNQLYVMRDVIRQRQILLNQMLAADDVFEIDTISLEFFALAKPFRLAREQLEALPINADEQKIVEQLIEKIRLAQPVNQRAAESMLSESRAKQSIELVRNAQVLQDELMRLMDQLITARKNSEQQFVAEGKRSYETVFYGSLISALFIIVLIVMIGRIITSYVYRKNNELLIKNQELEKATKTALEATHSKSAFLATMSHEIRTPLTAIIGFAEINLEHKVSEENRIRHTKSIARNGRHLLQIINDILDLSKIEANSIEYESQPFSLFKLVRDVELIIQPQVKDKGLGFNIDYNYPLPVTITGDALRLKQVLLNLAINAVKFTEAGRVNLKVCCNIEKQQIQFDVIDTGIGMTEEQIGTVFEAFKQADSSVTRKYGGTGLGLALSKQFVEGMEGRIEVDSLPGVGSRFSVMLATGDLSDVECVDQPDIEEQQLESDNENDLKNISGRILLVEDSIDNQQLLATLLAKTSAKVDVANNGKQAVAMADVQKYDLVLMDIQMPIMDGLEATRQLKATQAEIPVVALTANALNQDRKACFEAGCTDYLTKPINKVNFYYVVSKYLQPEMDVKAENINVEIDDADVISLKNRFLQSLSMRLSNIENELSRGNINKAKKDVHTLRGLSGSFGLIELSKIAEEIEQALQYNNTDKVSALMQGLTHVISRISQLDKSKTA